MGADITIAEEKETSNEPTATLLIRGGLKRCTAAPVIRGGIIANLIDEIPILSILGTQLDSGLEIRDAAELRVKESDRIASIVENLNRMGAAVTEFQDGFRVEWSQLKGCEINSFGDHRIAMAFAIAGLLASDETMIDGAECANVSFPGFFDALAAVYSKLMAKDIRIALTGFMGVGKSSVARHLASKLKCRQIDLDHFIEKNERRSVADIIDADGIEHYRHLETQNLETIFNRVGR